MKRLFIIALFIAAILSTAPIYATVLDMNNQFYLKATVGINKFQKLKLTREIPQIPEVLILYPKRKYVPIINFGIGYYLADKLRVELETGYINSKTTLTKTLQLGTNVVKITGKTKPIIFTGMFSAYVDLATFDIIQPFIGAGLGVALVTDKESATTTLNGTIFPDASGTTSKKRKANFSYQFTIGVGGKITKDVIAELAYRCHHYGNSQRKDIDSKISAYKSDNITISIRWIV